MSNKIGKGVTLISHTTRELSSYPAEALTSIDVGNGQTMTVIKSDYSCAFTRGLKRPNIVEGRFVYTNAVDSPFGDHSGTYVPPPFDDTDGSITSVTFCISRYKKITKTINLPNPTTVCQMISIVENHLSQPLTEEWFDKVKEDSWGSDLKWSEYKDCELNRGFMLTDAKFIESLSVEGSHLTIHTN